MKQDEIKNIHKAIADNNVKFIKLFFCDCLGELKCIEIGVSNLGSALENKIMFDGSSVKGFSSVEKADTLLKPDLGSFRLLPLFNSGFGAVACFFCDVISANGTQIKDSRSGLKAMLAELGKYGFDTVNIGFEPEFFLLKAAGSFADCGGYDSSNESVVSACKREMCYRLEEAGIIPTTSHHENAYGQHEVNFKHSPAVTACDNILLFKHIAKFVAGRHGFKITFMPKPYNGQAGNGLHTNISLQSRGKNLFAGKNKKLSMLAKKFISGVLHHAEALSVVTNPTVNSYKRLNSGFEAPRNICYSTANRSALIRVPKAYGESARIEVRNVDASANPYLAAMALTAAGTDGIRGSVPIQKEFVGNAYNFPPGLPATLGQAIDCFVGSGLEELLQPYLPDAYIGLKRAEADEAERVVTEWELDRYFEV
ncbi:MAG: glutamine synthetase family protein [Firmicutes bacterium]|nr:glutamine synthetase family protein [Bacillota bacterium]